MTNKQIKFGVGIFVLLLSTAALASYVTREAQEKQEQEVVAAKTKTVHTQKIASAQPAAAAPATPPCNDSNIVGTLVGGAAGGVLGSKIGNGSGKTVATIGGALGGAYVGNQYIPTRNVTCR